MQHAANRRAMAELLHSPEGSDELIRRGADVGLLRVLLADDLSATPSHMYRNAMLYVADVTGEMDTMTPEQRVSVVSILERLLAFGISALETPDIRQIRNSERDSMASDFHIITGHVMALSISDRICVALLRLYWLHYGSPDVKAFGRADAEANHAFTTTAMEPSAWLDTITNERYTWRQTHGIRLHKESCARFVHGVSMARRNAATSAAEASAHVGLCGVTRFWARFLHGTAHAIRMRLYFELNLPPRPGHDMPDVDGEYEHPAGSWVASCIPEDCPRATSAYAQMLERALSDESGAQAQLMATRIYASRCRVGALSLAESSKRASDVHDDGPVGLHTHEFGANILGANTLKARVRTASEKRRDFEPAWNDTAVLSVLDMDVATLVASEHRPRPCDPDDYIKYSAFEVFYVRYLWSLGSVAMDKSTYGQRREGTRPISPRLVQMGLLEWAVVSGPSRADAVWFQTAIQGTSMDDIRDEEWGDRELVFFNSLPRAIAEWVTRTHAAGGLDLGGVPIGMLACWRGPQPFPLNPPPPRAPAHGRGGEEEEEEEEDE